jgi:hypothetical protein
MAVGHAHISMFQDNYPARHVLMFQDNCPARPSIRAVAVKAKLCRKHASKVVQESVLSGALIDPDALKRKS